MPAINIEHLSQLPAKECYNKVKDLLSRGDLLKKFDNQIQYQFDDSKMTGEIKGGQFKASVNVTESGENSKVSITIEIPFLFSAFKGKIQSSIEKQLKELIS